MKKFIFISGGVKSGKSSYAINLAQGFNKNVTFLATAIAFDDEMKDKMEGHKKQRPKDWNVIEETRNIGPLLTKVTSDNAEGVVVVDSLRLLVSNLLMYNMSSIDIEDKMLELVSAAVKSPQTVIIISSEVGCGVVPENSMARKFRDLVGNANRLMAEAADIVVLMQSGIPVFVKGEMPQVEMAQ